MQEYIIDSAVGEAEDLANAPLSLESIMATPPIDPLSPLAAAELTSGLVTLLSPYHSEIRQRAIHAALTLLGDGGLPPRPGAPAAALATTDEFSDLELGPKAFKWLQRHGITRAMLDEVFHLSGHDVDITASEVPGPGRREMTVNCYLLCGARGLLKTDSPSVDDSEAIALCKRLTAYDKNNHTTYRSAMGNRMTGTRPNFTLTGPGEGAAAELVKRMGARSGSPTE